MTGGYIVVSCTEDCGTILAMTDGASMVLARGITNRRTRHPESGLPWYGMRRSGRARRRGHAIVDTARGATSMSDLFDAAMLAKSCVIDCPSCGRETRVDIRDTAT